VGTIDAEETKTRGKPRATQHRSGNRRDGVSGACSPGKNTLARRFSVVLPLSLMLCFASWCSLMQSTYDRIRRS
jgi:hypothetical protein